MAHEPPYPETLPVIDPAWLLWNDGTIKKLAQEIHEKKDWSRLAILADALEEAGCTDDVILSHLREINRKCDNCKGKGWWSCKEKFPSDTHPEDDRVFRCHSCETMHKDTYRDGCWQKECWLINHLLNYDQPLEAEYSFLGQSMADSRMRAPVIAQGEWGRGMVVTIGYGPAFFVESEGESDLDDTLVDDDKWGHLARIPESDYSEWGFRVSGGDRVAGIDIAGDGWVNLKGEFIPDSENLADLREAHTSGSGNHYDSEEITWDHVSNVRYFGPGLPKAGVTPEEYHGRKPCDHCTKTIYIADRVFTYPDWQSDFCSVWCMLASHGYEFAVRCSECRLLTSPMNKVEMEEEYEIHLDALTADFVTVPRHLAHRDSHTGFADEDTDTEQQKRRRDDGVVTAQICIGSHHPGEIVNLANLDWSKEGGYSPELTKRPT